MFQYIGAYRLNIASTSPWVANTPERAWWWSRDHFF